MSRHFAIGERVFRATIITAVLVLCAVVVLPAVAPAQAPPTPKPQTCSGETKEVEQIADGVTWTHLCREAPANPTARPAADQPAGAPAGPWSIHVLEVSRAHRELEMRTRIGANESGQFIRTPLTDLAGKARAAGEDVLAAVNGDYDMADPYLGIPIGLAVTDGKVWSAGGPARPALAILRSGEPVIGVPNEQMELRVAHRSLPIASLNKPLGNSPGPGLRLFTRAFQPSVKAAKPFRAAVISQIQPALPIVADGDARGVVQEVRDAATEQRIPDNALLVADPAGTADSESVIARLKTGENIELHFHLRIGGKSGVRDAVGGLPMLVTHGHVAIAGEGEPGDYLLARHPRTAVCTNAREIIFVVVDGRQPKLSVGMTLEELASYMVSLGCTEAMNTDGGGSAEMALALGKYDAILKQLPVDTASDLSIVNSPSDGHERGRPNAWLLIRKRQTIHSRRGSGVF